MAAGCGKLTGHWGESRAKFLARIPAHGYNGLIASQWREVKRMPELIRMPGASEVVSVSISELPNLQAALPPGAEAIVTRHSETVGVFMSPARRNALAALEERVAELELMNALLLNGKTVADIEHSRQQARQGQARPASAFLAELQAEVTATKHGRR
jgi:hypothetical protein